MKTMKTIWASCLLLVGIVSCQKSALDPLVGIYPDVQRSVSSALQNLGVTEISTGNIFHVGLTTDKNNAVSLDLVGGNWYLTPGTYVISADEKPGSCLTSSSWDGKTVQKGSVTVKKTEDRYEIGGLIWLSEEEIVKFTATGELVYEEKIIVPNYTYSIAADETRANCYNITLMDMTGALAANFFVRTGGEFAGKYTFTSDIDNIKDGEAYITLDLSFLGLGVLGSYFYEDGTLVSITAGNLEISGDESLYSFTLTNLDASNGKAEASFTNAVKPQPRDITLEGYSYLYTSADNDETGLTEHTIALKDAAGNAAGQVVIRTVQLGGVAGTFEVATDAVPTGFVAGFDASAFGLGIIGSYLMVEGKKLLLTNGNVSIHSNGGKLTLVASGMSNAQSISSVTVSDAEKVIVPDEPEQPVIFEVKEGTYTHTVTAAAGVDGVWEHTFVIKDGNGEDAGQILVRSAAEDSYTGLFPYVAAGVTAEAGYLVGGAELDLSAFGMGISNLGSFFVKEGKTWLLQAGTALVVEAEGKLSILISDAKAATGATAGSEISDVTVVSFDGLTEYVAPATGETVEFKNGTFTYNKENREAYTEHTVVYSDAEGNVVGQVVVRTEVDAAITGDYPAGSTETPGIFVPGMDFFGMANIGTYYVKDGTVFYVTGGTLSALDFFGFIGVSIKDAVSADGSGNPGAATISFSDMSPAQ